MFLNPENSDTEENLHFLAEAAAKNALFVRAPLGNVNLEYIFEV
jgi:hypothetical protein